MVCRVEWTCSAHIVSPNLKGEDFNTLWNFDVWALYTYYVPERRGSVVVDVKKCICIHSLHFYYFPPCRNTQQLLAVSCAGLWVCLKKKTRARLLLVPGSNYKTYGDRSFSVCPPKLCNSLPYSLRKSSSLVIFKTKLKTYLFNIFINSINSLFFNSK